MLRLGEFNVDDIQEPDWKDTAYDNLVLPEDEKKLVRAFVDSRRFRQQNFDDFMPHKGRKRATAQSAHA
jgi:hypothetical protein